MIVAYRTIYDVSGVFDTRMYDGVVEMLDELGEHGRTLCVATSKPETSARRVVDHLGLTDRFNAMARGRRPRPPHARPTSSPTCSTSSESSRMTRSS